MREPKILKRVVGTFLCIVLALSSSPSFAQGENSWKETPITLRRSNVTLGEMLQLVTQQAKATIEFREVSLVGIDEPISMNVSNRPLDKVIAELIGNQNVMIEYDHDRHIIISAYAKAPGDKSAAGDVCQISGVVTDAKTGEPLVGATIIITDGTNQVAATARGTITDLNGKFDLNVNRKESVRISYLGYQTQSIQILRPDNRIKIEMVTDGTLTTDEVVVTGISKRSKTSFTGNFVEVTGDKLREINPNNFLKSLQFFDPSFKVVESNTAGSNPNAQPEFRMRGDQTMGLTT